MADAYLAETTVGIFGLDGKGKPIARGLYRLEVDSVAERMMRLRVGEPVYEVEEVVRGLKRKGYRSLVLENEALAASLRSRLKVKVSVQRPCQVIEDFREAAESYALSNRLFKDVEGYREFTRRVSVELARVEVKAAAARRDLFLAQTIRVLDDLEKTANLYSGRMREWYGSTFPELDRLVEKHETYIRLVSILGERGNYTEEKLIAAGIPHEKSKGIAEAVRSSMGTNLSPEDLGLIQNFGNLALEIYRFHEKATEYVSRLAESVAPNMTAIVGPALTSRLISLAGGLEKLAKMPASTMQVLGAEKALFRALRTGAKPPKHGVIFQHASIHQSPWWQRGKIARAMAGKLTIAARIDAFHGAYAGEGLRREVERRVKDIQDRYSKPPPPKERVERREKHRGRRR